MPAQTDTARAKSQVSMIVRPVAADTRVDVYEADERHPGRLVIVAPGYDAMLCFDSLAEAWQWVNLLSASLSLADDQPI